MHTAQTTLRTSAVRRKVTLSRVSERARRIIRGSTPTPAVFQRSAERCAPLQTSVPLNDTCSLYPNKERRCSIWTARSLSFAVGLSANDDNLYILCSAGSPFEENLVVLRFSA
jgi:hypothetical protein